MNFQEPIGGLVERIARALERLAPPLAAKARFRRAEAFVWQAEPEAFLPVAKRQPRAARPAQGHRPHARHALDNTRRFARGLPANNALLWGARGMGKSSLVKAVHAAVSREASRQGGRAEARRDPPRGHRPLPRCLRHLRDTKGKRFILFCDDLSFDARRHLLQVAEGGARRRHRRAARATCCSTRPRTGAI